MVVPRGGIPFLLNRPERVPEEVPFLLRNIPVGIQDLPYGRVLRPIAVILPQEEVRNFEAEGTKNMISQKLVLYLLEIFLLGLMREPYMT
jgi:hypothetical protein